ncbi:MAG TPA: class I SAM-dependent methyltransferase, partial [Nitrospira sp.]|nr:class I SAM-dependent methyltransferase [Nitrospira sp.]
DDPDALPQPLGEYKPVDQWQAHINHLFYQLRGDQQRSFYQTFTSADYRLAHALAADYYEQVLRRDKKTAAKSAMPGGQSVSNDARQLIVMEWGPGNGNLAACFLSHVQRLDKASQVYPRIRYVLVDSQAHALEQARAHPDLAPHLAQVESLRGDVENLSTIAGGSVDRIICNELWNELATKLLAKKGADYEEEYLRPNLHERNAAAIADWSGFVRAFDSQDIERLKQSPPFLDDLIWECEYHKVEWKDIPYRKTITEFLKGIDDEVLVPVNLGACASIKEAKRVLAPDAVGFSSFDAGTADLRVLNDPNKPCYGQFGGQYSFMVNLALIRAVAKHLGLAAVTVETQREFIGSRLGTNVMTLMDLLACHPMVNSKVQPWELDRLTVQTIRTLNEHYESPYQRKIEFPLRSEMPAEEREAAQGTLLSLKSNGIPDTIAYVTEEELSQAQGALEELGYEREAWLMALGAPPSPVEYYHFSFRP